MDPARFTRIDETTWQIEPIGAMRVPGVIYADEDLIRAMDDKVYEQTANVATLPGIVKAALVMPDAHWGYGFPIGGVAAFDADEGGVISAGGVGFDVSCGVRTMLTGLTISDIKQVQKSLADSLYQQIPAGLGSKGSISLDPLEMDAMLRGGARWAIERAWGEARDLDRIEEGGQMTGAHPGHVSERAKERQRREMGTLGSGNHYVEVQAVAEIFDQKAAEGFGLKQDEVVVTIHCGSRGLGHQIGTEFLREMVTAAAEAGIALPDRELACAPIKSEVGQRYLGAMRAAINCALANREIIGHYARKSSRTSSLMPISLCSSTCRTTPARSRSTGLTARLASSSCIAREPPGLLVQAIQTCRRLCARSDSPCSSAAAWGLGPTCWSEPRRAKRSRSPLPAMALAAPCRATLHFGHGVAAVSSMSSRKEVF